jgi:hypothetical protein
MDKESGNADKLAILIEKIFLLHQEYNREDECKMRNYRMPRHNYDLFRIYQLPEYSKALDNNQFIEDIIEHRISDSRRRNFDYNTLCKVVFQSPPSVRINCIA